MDDAEKDEKRQRAGKQVASEDGREDEVSQQIQGLARKAVEQVSGEGADAKCGKGVAGKYDADGRFIRPEGF